MITPEKEVSTLSFTYLSDYEQWAAQNWLFEPGTDRAQLHARAKLDEEITELSDALVLAAPADIISEAGDVLWTATASSSNAGISISESLRETYPTLFNTEPISTGQVDKFSREIFADFTTQDTQTLLNEYGSKLSKASKQWFRLSPLVTATPTTFAEALITTKRDRTIDALANVTLLTSYSIQAFASSDLQTAMLHNHQKIEERIKAGSAVTKPPRV